MQMNLFHMILIIFLALTWKFALSGLFKKKSAKVSEERTERRIVGHEKAEQATPMATRTMAPAFAEVTDWTEYDKPAYERKKPAPKKRTPKKAAPANVEVTVPAQSKTATKTKATKQTPQQAMDEFRQNAANRASGNARYEEV